MDLILNEELISRLLKGQKIADPFAVMRQRKQACLAVMAALCRGILARPSECSACRSIGKIQAHHNNYDKPLEVEWLCGRCHAKADRVRRLRDGQRPLGDDFAAFLLLNKGVDLPVRDDPPGDGYCIERAIRSFYFAGFDANEQTPLVWWELSCGHERLERASELWRLPTAAYCGVCTDAWRTKRSRKRKTGSSAQSVGVSL